MTVSLKLLFLAAALTSCIVGAVVVWRLSYLQQYVDGSIRQADDNFLAMIAVDLALAADVVHGDFNRIVATSFQSRLFTTSVIQSLPNPLSLSTVPGVVATLEPIFLPLWAAKAVGPMDIYGWGISVLLPRGSNGNVTSVQAMHVFVDPSFDDDVVFPMYAWTDPLNGSNVAHFITYVPATPSTPQVLAPGAAAFSYEWRAIAAESYGEQPHYDFYARRSADGHPFWFIRHAAFVSVNGVDVAVESFGITHHWDVNIGSIISTPGVIFFVFGDVAQLYSTNFLPENDRREGCQGDVMLCINVGLDDQHPLSFIRGVYETILKPLQEANNGSQAVFGSGAAVVEGIRYLYQQELVIDFGRGQAFALMMAPRQTVVNSDKNTVTLLMVLIMIVVFVSTAVFGAFVHAAFLQPVNVLIARMGLVSRLDFSQLAKEAEPHALSEMLRLEKGYFEMANQLNRIKSFVPQSVLESLVEHSSDSDEEDALTDPAQQASPSAPSVGSVERRQLKSANPRQRGSNATVSAAESPTNSVDLSSFGLPPAASTRSRRSSSSPVSRNGSVSGENLTKPNHGETFSTTSSTVEMTVEKSIASDLASKSVSVVVLNLRKFHSLRDSASRLADVQSFFLSIVTKTAKEVKGVVDYFQGDHVFVSFNAVRPCASHARRASKLAWTVLKEACHRPDLPHVTAGFSSGTALIGNMGTAAMKRFCIVGPVVTEALHLERLSTDYPPATSILFPHKLVDDIGVEYFSQCVDVVRLPGQAKDELVRALEGPKAMELNEWMYQLQQGESQDPFAAINDCFVALCRGEKVVVTTILANQLQNMEPTRFPGMRRIDELLEKM